MTSRRNEMSTTTEEPKGPVPMYITGWITLVNSFILLAVPIGFLIYFKLCRRRSCCKQEDTNLNHLSLKKNEDPENGGVGKYNRMHETVETDREYENKQRNLPGKKNKLSKESINLLWEKVEYLIHYKDKPTLSFESERIFRNVKQYICGDLDEVFCIITFYYEQPVDDIVEDCFEGRKREKNLRRTKLIIKEARDVLQLPPARVFLVFIDKKEDDLILETLGRDASDLRLLTVKSCIRMNAEVFVIYFGDKDSENLMPGLLYNPQIAAVTEHSELKELERYDKVITCSNKFTTTQREKIAEFIV